ncbi:solute carrier family 22 member 7-like isoform X2 [Homarus americanus]|uniref:solute carrier family 22 member 7-like isoform X2 n=1 Tax=Homarus americanus TaxID=6706 RepID=UPI001C47F238|nr:solute carrier family 22 member 7-like isoform X2 [Homarus americanus]
MSEEDGFDHLLSKVGFGRWQLLMISTSLFMTMVLPIHMVGSPLISAPVSFRCFADATSDDGFQPSFERVNSSSSNSSDYYNSICLNHTIPVTVATLEATTNSNSSTRRRTNLPSCPFIKYDSSIFTSTVISEYDLVCERMSLQPYYQMVFNIGGILGSFIGGHIGDRWGRKKAVQIGALGNILAVLGMVFVPSYPFILLMRLLNGCSCIGVLIPTWSLILESTPSNIRSLVGMLGGLPYSVCVIAFAGVSYYIRTWQYLLLVCSSPVTLLLPLSFIVNESPRWLVQNGRAKEATKILERAVKQNKVKLSDNLETIINKIIEAGTKPSQQNENQDDQKSALSEYEPFPVCCAHGCHGRICYSHNYTSHDPTGQTHHCRDGSVCGRHFNFAGPACPSILFLAQVGAGDGRILIGGWIIPSKFRICTRTVSNRNSDTRLCFCQHDRQPWVHMCPPCHRHIGSAHLVGIECGLWMFWHSWESYANISPRDKPSTPP